MTQARRDAIARIVLAPLLLAILVGVLFAPWHSALSIDSRTQIEMIRGISQHGLPYMENGPLDRYPELEYAWNVARDGHLWGSYPPLYAYVAAPVFLGGGLKAVSRLSFVLLAAIVLGTVALVRRTTNDSLLGAFAGYVVCLATPISIAALDIGAYELAVALITWAFFFATRSLDEEARASQRSARVAGLLGGLAVATHLLTLPMFASLVVALGLLPIAGSPPLVRVDSLSEWMPTRASLVRGANAALGATAPLCLVSLLNHVRFGSWSPITYGPCVWNRCSEVRGNDNALALLAHTWPFLAWLLVVVLAMWSARNWRFGRLACVVVGALAIVPHSFLHASAIGTLRLLWGYVFDVSGLTMPPMVHPPDGLGNFLGPYVIKSTLQATPAMALCVLAPSATLRERQTRVLLGLGVASLYGLLAMRSNMPMAHALGYPFLHLRYVVPALPLATALAVSAARGLPWRPAHLVAIVLIAAAGAIVLGVTGVDENDLPFARRFLVLRVTLGLAIAAVLLTWLSRKVSALRASATAACLLAFASGFATNCGIDLPAIYALRFHNDELVDALAERTPARFALVGYAREVDVPLTLRATRDVEVADLVEAKDWRNFRELVDMWSSEGRPIYGIWPPSMPIVSPWPDVKFEVLDEPRAFFRIVRSSQ